MSRLILARDRYNIITVHIPFEIFILEYNKVLNKVLGTHHDIVALHLGLLLGKFLQLQFNTGQNKQEIARVSKTLVSAGDIQKLWGGRKKMGWGV